MTKEGCLQMITGKGNASIRNKNRSYLPKATPARLTNYRMKKSPI